MKQEEIRNKSNENLLRLKKDLDINLIQAKYKFGDETVKNRVAKIESKKGMTQKGTRTSLRKQLRRTIAQVETEINQRGLNDKRISKRRKRRLRGKIK